MLQTHKSVMFGVLSAHLIKKKCSKAAITIFISSTWVRITVILQQHQNLDQGHVTSLPLPKLFTITISVLIVIHL